VVGDQEKYIALDLEIETDYLNEEESVEKFIGVFPATHDWSAEAYACLLTLEHLLENSSEPNIDYKKYSRTGMIRRVLDERQQKAKHAEYRIKWGDNIYGDHILTNENGEHYRVFLRDFENETGYSNSKDAQVNKLGTTKHIMFAFNALKNNASLYKRLKKQFPFVEVYCDPLHEYHIRYYFTDKLDTELQKLFDKYFDKDGFVKKINYSLMPQFFAAAENFSNIVIRPEVKETLSAYFEQRALESLQQQYIPDFSSIKATLYDYQKEGVTFAACRKHAIIADEMGLGKTIQAIGGAVLKKEIFGFKKTLIVCPASLKAQWKKEIEKFSSEQAEIIEGLPDERAQRYSKSESYFLIVNYETVLRDQVAINNAGIDFLILDEAQKVKNYATKSASAIKKLDRKHVLIITGTPIENKLIDLFSIMSILDPHLLGPLWEFSYQHCLFDNEKPNKINAYYNLTSLNEQLKTVLLRREKRKVIEQLPNIQQQDVPIGMTSLQADFHASYASGIGQIIRKKFLTP
jgi:SNF2 family DNA or RNA helicase